MKEIQLSKKGKHKGKYVALVDDEDFERVNQFNWCLCSNKSWVYAKRAVYINGKQKTIRMHNFLMGSKEVDHEDHNGLNNQKYNLRSCTHQQNMVNKSVSKNATSIYLGVHWYKEKKKWCCQITSNNRKFNLGYFTDEIDAAKAYDLKSRELNGKFANLNFKRKRKRRRRVLN